MRHGSLFSGIGGFDLAAEWMGWENVFHCEWNEFGQKILKHYWPNAISYGDITKTDFTVHRGEIDVLSGGFPCQPFSSSGEQKGSADERYLFPEMFRAIREIKPKWVVAENVYGITDAKFKPVFTEIYTSLETYGYQVQAYNIPATAIEADHSRQRIWFVAHTDRTGLQVAGEFKRPISSKKKENREADRPELLFRGQPLPHLYQHNDGFPSELAGHSLSEWRSESNKGLGNAIMPKIAYELFKAINEYQ